MNQSIQLRSQPKNEMMPVPLTNYGAYRPIQEFPLRGWYLVAPQRSLLEGFVGLALAAGFVLGAVVILKDVLDMFAPLYNNVLLSQSTRNYVSDRDEEVCYYCDCWDPNGHVDHITNRANGGGNEDEDLTLACAPCNLAKSRLYADEFHATFN